LNINEITIRLPESVYRLLENQAAEEFFNTSDDAVRLIIHRAIVYHLGNGVDAKQIAQDLVAEKHKPLPIPTESERKTKETVGEAKKVLERNGKEKTKIDDVVLPQKLYQGNPNGQWVILSFIANRVFTNGYWESFTKSDVATGTGITKATVSSALANLVEKGWFKESLDNRDDPFAQVTYTTTLAARRWLFKNQGKLVQMGLVKAIERAPKDENYIKYEPEPVRISNGKDHMPL
jgi:hypothetical protein